MEIRLNSQIYPQPVLNDILICHECPAAMSHYRLILGRIQERQKSSGIWISTAAGSTGAVRSLGGQAQSLGSRQFQYRPRELYWAKNERYRLTGGIFNPQKKLKIISQMKQGRIYIDGAHASLEFGTGSVLSVVPSKYLLKAILS